MTDDIKQEVLEILRTMPAWGVPVWLRMGNRLLNGVPFARAEQLFWQEAEIARLRASRPGGPEAGHDTA